MSTANIGWTPEQKASLVERLKPYDKGQGLVNWRAAREAGVIAAIETDFGKGEKTIRSFYNYAFRRHAWKNVNGKPNPAKRKYSKRVEAPSVKPTQPAPVNTLKWCPHCGGNLMVFQAAANLHG